jgi:hypothetical protein
MAGFKDNLAVPERNSADDYSIRDVVGNKSDTSFSGGSFNGNPSLVGHSKAGYYHIHSPAKVYPSLADSINVVASATAWTLGTKVVIIPINTMPNYFDIHWIIVHSISAVDEYELVLYSDSGSGDVEIGRVVFVKTAAQAQEGNLPIQIPPQRPNSKISAALASKSGGDTVSIKLYYHEYSDI